MVWHSLACFKWEHLSDPEFHQIIQMTCENDLETLTWHFDVTRDQLWFLQAPKNVLQESELRQCKSNNPPLWKQRVYKRFDVCVSGLGANAGTLQKLHRALSQLARTCHCCWPWLLKVNDWPCRAVQWHIAASSTLHKLYISCLHTWAVCKQGCTWNAVTGTSCVHNDLSRVCTASLHFSHTCLFKRWKMPAKNCLGLRVVLILAAYLQFRMCKEAKAKAAPTIRIILKKDTKQVLIISAFLGQACCLCQDLDSEEI